MISPLLVVEDLHVEFPDETGTVHALRGVSLTLDRGEVLGLVGETGCGKSVTGLAILGLVPQPGRIKSGRIFLDGQDLTALDEAHLRKLRGRNIGMIFQDPVTSLNPVFTNGRQVLNVIERHLPLGRAAARQRALELFASVGLPDPEAILEGYPHQLSGGMQQRVMIAMALAAGPELIIADEPTTAVDVTIQAQILDLLLKLQRERGIAILLITHNLGVVAETCHRVAVLYAGRVVEESPVDEFFQEPRHPYSQGLLHSLPRLNQAADWLTPIPGNVPSGHEDLPGCAFAARCEHATQRCWQSQPPMYAAGVARRVACFLAEEAGR